ncbi:MAG: hypothetical protein MI810_24395 [Flavobacteriales bacterium]|jgi:hypothetical protein|nr:hypothetical protein [Flavobacteriales bacterium]
MENFNVYTFSQERDEKWAKRSDLVSTPWLQSFDILTVRMDCIKGVDLPIVLDFYGSSLSKNDEQKIITELMQEIGGSNYVFVVSSHQIEKDMTVVRMKDNLFYIHSDSSALIQILNNKLRLAIFPKVA